MSHCLWDPVAVDVVEFAGHCWSRMLSVCVVFWDFPVTLVFGPQWLRSLIVMLMFSSSILVLLSSSSITSDNKEEVWWLDVSWDVASALLCKTNSICFRVSYFGGTEALIRSLEGLTSRVLFCCGSVFLFSWAPNFAGSGWEQFPFLWTEHSRSRGFHSGGYSHMSWSHFKILSVWWAWEPESWQRLLVSWRL